MTLLTDFFTRVTSLECREPSTLVGICVIKNQDDLALCQALLDNDYEIVFEGGLQVGEWHFTYSPSTAEGYASYDDFLPIALGLRLSLNWIRFCGINGQKVKMMKSITLMKIIF